MRFMTEEEYYNQFKETADSFNGIIDPLPYEEYMFRKIAELPVDEQLEIIDLIIKNYER